MHRRLLLLCLALGGCTCEGAAPPLQSTPHPVGQPGPPGGRASSVLPRTPADHPQVKRARQVVDQLRAGLKGALMEAMRRGPEAAVEVCASRAQKITRTLDRDGLAIGRTSSAVRNPVNAPRAWVKPVLEDYLRRPAGPTYRTVDLGQGKMGYVEPIYTSRLCLTCHGPTVTASVTQHIRQHYPEDRATGFSAGDLRGVFWVEVPPVR